MMFPTSVDYNEANLKTALDSLKTFDANYGGTEILRPIRDVMTDKNVDATLPR